jgi:hypothetical protein
VVGGTWKRLKTKAETWEPLPTFYEVAPNVWVPHGYRPTEWERPTPVVSTTEQAAAEYARCAASLPHFLLRHGWSLHTDDPSGEPQYRKFPAYPYVLDFLTHVQEPENVHVEKSRQLLFSWMWMGVFLWDILFHENWANVAFSALETLVDDGGPNSTTDSLFGKMRFIWQGLPPYVQHPISWKRLLVQCPATGSYVRGRAASPKGGRGPAYKRGLVDEAAHIEHSETLFRAIRASIKHGLVLNSTPLGKGNVFARIRFSQTTTFRRLSYHWSRHPERAEGTYCDCGWRSDPDAKTALADQFAAHACVVQADAEPHERPPRKMRSPWYDTAVADLTPEQVASEYDLSYEKSQRGRVYDPFDETRHVVEYQHAIGPRQDHEPALTYRKRYLRWRLDPTLITVCGWDFGVQDPTALCLGQVVDEATMRIRWIDEFEHNNESWRFYKEFVHSLWAPIVKEVTRLDILHYGDPSGKGRNAELTSWISNLALPPRKPSDPAAIRIITGPRTGRNLEWYDFIRELIRRGEFEVSEWCTRMIDGLGQYHFPLDSEGNPVPGEHEPVHDEWSHMMAAKRYVYMFRYHTRLKRVEAGSLVPAKSMLGVGRGNRRDQAKRF